MSAPRILVVDDDPDVLFLVGMRLRKNGYEVRTAPDGDIAVAIARREQPSLILLDLGLPEMDGFEVCRILKSDPATHAISIVVLSAKSQQEDRTRAIEAGADRYLTKPFDPGVLLGEIKNMLKKESIMEKKNGL